MVFFPLRFDVFSMCYFNFFEQFDVLITLKPEKKIFFKKHSHDITDRSVHESWHKSCLLFQRKKTIVFSCIVFFFLYNFWSNNVANSSEWRLAPLHTVSFIVWEVDASHWKAKGSSCVLLSIGGGEVNFKCIFQINNFSSLKSNVKPENTVWK